MRSTKDRIRHALVFEALALAIVIPLGAWVFDKPMFDIGVLGLASAMIAVAWNYLYNLGFDHAKRRLTGTVRKTPALRVAHAIAFEVGLLAVLLPLIAWYLDIGLWEAPVMDLGFAGFYVVYAFIYNWAYDVIFPVEEQPSSRAASRSA
ncbi:MAG TPA: hypothetical protein DEA05_00680 [Rhodobacteraceae bacterium]|jgi:uncharacterized membrane protein|nr:hypothetical protein [Paracoccaceae bacterium]